MPHSQLVLGARLAKGVLELVGEEMWIVAESCGAARLLHYHARGRAGANDRAIAVGEGRSANERGRRWKRIRATQLREQSEAMRGAP